MMEQLDTFSKGNSPGEYAALTAMTASGGKNVFREKPLQYTGLFPPNSGAYGTAVNVSVNPTYASLIVIIQRTANSAEDTSGLGVSSISRYNTSFSREATKTNIRNKNSPSGLFWGTLVYSDLESISELMDKLPSITWPTPVEETSFRAYYDIVPERTTEDFLAGYQARLARVKGRFREYVDIDLPIVDDGGDW